jgi:hypothetical protein
MDGTTLFVLAGIALALGGGAFALVLVKRRRRATAAEVHHFRCPGCRRRLRFLARQVGHKGECSHCGQDVTFPLVSQSVD